MPTRLLYETFKCYPNVPQYLWAEELTLKIPFIDVMKLDLLAARASNEKNNNFIDGIKLDLLADRVSFEKKNFLYMV